MNLGLVFVTFASGYFPNVFTNKKVLNLLAVFGGGFLLGVAILVVLPECVGLMVTQNYR
jgi:zinc transporter ZupT